VLVVDDIRHARPIAARILSEEGYRVRRKRRRLKGK
jgi:hypothetical protein